MARWFLLILFSFPLYAQEDLDFYIRRFRYFPIEMPAKRETLYKLGFKLFYDKNLSGKNNISCQSCHSHEGFSADALPLGLGEGAQGIGKNRQQKNGLILNRHTQSIYNLGHPEFDTFFWDGRVANVRGVLYTPEPKFNGAYPELKHVVDTFDSVLSIQTIFPLASPEEMLGKESKLTRLEAWDLVLKKIFEGPDKAQYKKMFKAAYPEAKEYNIAHVGNALAELIRHHFTATDTPWDRYLKGDKEALNERMKRGAVLFHTKANCIFCHNGDHFTNQTFHNIGVPQLGADDKGMSKYRFKVPPLRNVGVTAPYMHSGVFRTLREVINHYNDPVTSLRTFKWEGRYPNYNGPLNLDNDPVRLDTKEESLSGSLARNLDLTEEEKNDLICFLAVGLTDMSLQKELLKQGVVHEISDCGPRTR